MAPDTIQRTKRLLDHLAWSHRRALEAARRTGDDEVRRLLSHLVGAETVWIRRLEGSDTSEVEIWPVLSLDTCERRMAENREDYRRFLAGLSPGDLDRPVVYRNSAGKRFRTPIGEVLDHVALHHAYHQGQIADRLREAGEEPVDILFITYVRENPGPSI